MAEGKSARFVVGEKIVLHNVAFPSKSNKMDTFVAVTVIETKQVPCVWGGSSGGLGILAESADGRKFRCNWETFPSDSGSPYWMWYMDGWEKDKGLNVEDFIWYDVTQGLMFEVDFEPIFLPQFSDILGHCQIHKSLYYKADGCWRCWLEEKYPKAKTERLERLEQEAQEVKIRPFQGWK
jgi:hypothetical protein